MEYKTLVFLILCPWKVLCKHVLSKRHSQIQLHFSLLFYLPSRKGDQAVSRVKPSFPWVTLFSLYTKIGLTSGICFLQVSRVQMDCIFHNFRKNTHTKPKSQQEKMLLVFLPNTCIMYQTLAENIANFIWILYCATEQGVQVPSVLVTYITKIHSCYFTPCLAIHRI